MGIADNFTDVLSIFPDKIPLKEGGQKAVFLVTHPEYKRVVVKVGIYTDPQTLERIKREVRVLQGINSTYYPKVFEFQVLDASRFIIIEEYVDCKPLSDCIHQYTDLHKAMLLLRELVNGLLILWSKQIVHRDLKPDNILITSEGLPKIIDLGIARLLDEDSITRTIALKGPATPIYAAPEQLLNRKSSIDIRTDQFNLGIVLMQLLLGGEHPFNPQICGGGNSIVENILDGRWCKTFLDKESFLLIKPIVLKLLGKEPYMRYRTPEQLIEAINTYLRE